MQDGARSHDDWAEVYQSCYTEQLTALREPFGANLSNLTRADRRNLDAWCGPMQSAGNRVGLPGLPQSAACPGSRSSATPRRSKSNPRRRKKFRHANPPRTVETIADVAPPPPPRTSSSRLWLGLAIGGVARAGGTAFMLMRGKRVRHTACRGCGAVVEGGGDMCANCRHEAAEARRRAIAERAEEERLTGRTRAARSRTPSRGGPPRAGAP